MHIEVERNQKMTQENQENQNILKEKKILLTLFRYILNVIGEEQHIPIKTIENYDATYIQHESDGDTYFDVSSLKNYLERMKSHFINIIEDLKSTRSSYQMYLVIGNFEYNKDHKKAKK